MLGADSNNGGNKMYYYSYRKNVVFFIRLFKVIFLGAESSTRSYSKAIELLMNLQQVWTSNDNRMKAHDLLRCNTNE